MDFPEAFQNDEWECSIGNFQYEETLQQTTDESSLLENQKRLFELAITDNNLNLIKSLLDCGYDINTKNDIGDTALITALKSMNFEVAKYLLDANADVCYRCLKILVLNTEGTAVIRYIIPSLIANLKRRNVDDNRFFDYIVAARWNFEIVLLLRNNVITRKFLERNRKYDYRNSMNIAMERADIDNVELLMRYGNESSKWTFYQKVNAFALNKQIQLFEIYIERLSAWNVVCNEAILSLLFLYGVMTENFLQILLNYRIDEQVRKKTGIDLRTAMFANVNADAIELLKNQIFYVDTPGYQGKTALYYSVKKDLLKNVQFLLDSGANVNIKNEEGRTLLFYAINSYFYESARLLLEYGADVQVVDNSGVTAFHLVANMQFVYNTGVNLHRLSSSTKLIQCLVARLAIDTVQGLPINPKIQMQIDSMKEHKKYYISYCEQLKQLKKCPIEGSITFFDVLTDDIEKLSRALRDQEYISLLDHYSSIYKLHAFFNILLRKKLRNILNLYRVKCDIANLISETTETVIDFDHLVIEKISQYLTPYDTHEFMEYSMWQRCNS